MVGGPERYTYGHSAVVVDVHAGRTAKGEAAFFLRQLRPGMRVLDVGCGPGSITLGLAAVVSPAEVIGLDVEAGVIARAREEAVTRGAGNMRFEVGSAYDLPYADGTFRAVFAHTLLEHLREPGRAIAEFRRVLLPGGVLGLRDCDWGSGIFGPPDPLVEEAGRLYARLWEHNGGDPRCGRRLRALLREAGFARIETSASFRWDGTLASSRSFGELLAQRLVLPEFMDRVVTLGWADRSEVERISDACRAWAERPDAFAAMVMCEAIAWRD